LTTLFRENNIETEQLNYFNEPFTVETLTKLLTKTELKPFDFLRKGEAIFKESGFTKETADKEIIEAMVNYPNLLQRPIVEFGEKAVLARPIEKALTLINQG
jgi:arsenate reductase (glutaredoxin)